ncbi:hypothetical protein L7F22_039163 [Adiantum nelumboides]|nr:hypothetical protein [Adiantum nelumboides]
MTSDGPYRKLRVLLVDDNRINLSVLSTLLKRRFSNSIDGSPVCVDSGLKAIQLLRTNVFDCIMMDIQMPFLSGLDASIRIRNGEDGVLEANRSVHIVAVTTAVGDEPELAYRRAGMDGMIGKPVRFQDMEHYICPLAHEAFNAAASVNAISIDGESIMPPLPPTISRSERLFYLPANASIRAPCPDICRGADFEKMLRAQTRASLRKSGAIAAARTGSWSPSASGRRQLDKTEDDHISEEDISKNSIQSTTSIETNDHIDETPYSPAGSRGRVQDVSQARQKHSRNASLTISKRTLSQQIQRELDNMEGQSDLSDSGVTKVITTERPRAIHRTSSPAWLVAQGLDRDAGDQFVTSPTSPLSPQRLSSRPNWLLSTKVGSPLSSTSRNCSSNSNGSSTLSISNSSSDMDECEPPLLTPDREVCILRRDSERSNASDTSTDLPTPANEFPIWPVPSTFDVKALNRLSNDSSSTIDPCSDEDNTSFNQRIMSASEKVPQKRGSQITVANVLAHNLQETHLSN